MGGIISSALAPQLQAQRAAQEAMIARQLEMQQVMRERMVATTLAQARNTFQYYGCFAALACVGLPIIAYRKRNPALLLPTVPIGFITAFQYGLAYGGRMDWVLAESEAIMEREAHLLRMPGGPLSVAALDAAIAQRTAGRKG